MQQAACVAVSAAFDHQQAVFAALVDGSMGRIGFRLERGAVVHGSASVVTVRDVSADNAWPNLYG
jgi:hypothetical protein